MKGTVFGHPQVEDISGRVFGRLTVIRFHNSGNKKAQWECLCICGNTCLIYGKALRLGTKSCGCLHSDVTRKRFTTPGGYGTPEYRAWAQLLSRCNDSNNPRYSDYGGRGITVCERWSRFEHFLADMGNRPTVKHSIDRINNNGNYCPENCQWSTRSEQANNKRTNRILCIDGVARTLSQWAVVSGINRPCIHARLTLGWTEKEAVFSEKHEKYHKMNYRPPENRK